MPQTNRFILALAFIAALVPTSSANAAVDWCTQYCFEAFGTCTTSTQCVDAHSHGNGNTCRPILVTSCSAGSGVGWDNCTSQCDAFSMLVGSVGNPDSEAALEGAVLPQSLEDRLRQIEDRIEDLARKPEKRAD